MPRIAILVALTLACPCAALEVRSQEQWKLFGRAKSQDAPETKRTPYSSIVNRSIFEGKRALVAIAYWEGPKNLLLQGRVIRNHLRRVIEQVKQWPVSSDVLLVTNKPQKDVKDLVTETIEKTHPICAPDLQQNNLCLPWEANKVLRKYSTGLEQGRGEDKCDLWTYANCGGDLTYDYYVYLEHDIAVPPDTFMFWAKHVDNMYERGYILHPYRVQSDNRSLTDCFEGCGVRCLTRARAIIDDLPSDDYVDKNDKVYFNPGAQYAASMLMSKKQFEDYLGTEEWDINKTHAQKWMIRERATGGLLYEPHFDVASGITHLRLPVYHLQAMSYNGMLGKIYKVSDYENMVNNCYGPGGKQQCWYLPSPRPGRILPGVLAANRSTVEKYRKPKENLMALWDIPKNASFIERAIRQTEAYLVPVVPEGGKEASY